MSITKAGPICDVCGKYILMGPMNLFKVKGVDSEMHCHDKCKTLVLESSNDYRLLPDGPLKELFNEN